MKREVRFMSTSKRLPSRSSIIYNVHNELKARSSTCDAINDSTKASYTLIRIILLSIIIQIVFDFADPKVMSPP